MFFDRSGKVLLDCGAFSSIYNEKGIINPNIASTEVILEENERIIGLQSSGRNMQMAFHYSVQFIIGRK
jgi:hypothetical protein